MQDCVALGAVNNSTSYYFNPKYHYKNGLGTNGDLLSAVQIVVEKLVKDEKLQSMCMNEVKYYRDALGSFGRITAVNGRGNTLPGAGNVGLVTSRYFNNRKDLCSWNFGLNRPRVLPANRILITSCSCSYAFPCVYFFHLNLLPIYRSRRRDKWYVPSRAEGSDPDSPANEFNNGTRLIRAIQSFAFRLSARARRFRKGLPMKVLSFLVGFYCATALSTVIGQTGDWDILSAGLAVVVVEGIGALMYKASLSFVDRLKSIITVFNYWKAGLSLGLFLDAFKYEIDTRVAEDCNPFSFEFDFFPFFW